MTTDLRDRLDALGQAGTDAVHLSRPDLRPGPSRHRRLLAVGAVLAAVALVVGVVTWRHDGDGTGRIVTADRRASTVPPTTAATRTPMVAVVLGTGGEVTAPSTAQIRFVGADGSVIADRRWREVQQPAPGAPAGQVYAERGLLQRVPVGTVRIEITDPARPGSSCDTDVTTHTDSQLVVRATRDRPDAGAPCAVVTTADQWATGEKATPTPRAAKPYLGLTVEEAKALARTDGKTIRIVGQDGMDNAITRDLRPDRVNLTVYDDRVLAASIG